MAGIDGLQLVSIEHSNRCPFAEMGMHPKCPAAIAGPPKKDFKSMPTSMALSIMDDLGALGYDRLIMFSIYNEPMSDPRFFWLVDQLYARVPKARLRLLTNSLSINRALVEDLKRHDCACEIDAYTKEEVERMKLEGVDYYTVCARRHDNRLGLYNRPYHGRNDLAPCTAWNHLAIFHTGEICICCMDWARKEVLDDLRHVRLLDFLNGPMWNDTMRRLAAGERSSDLCRRCTWEPGRPV